MNPLSNAQIQYKNMLLQNSYNPYAQSTYVSNMAQTIQDWQLEKTFCINGNWMNLEEFVNFLYPENCAEKTYLILKLKGQKDEDNS